MLHGCIISRSSKTRSPDATLTRFDLTRVRATSQGYRPAARHHPCGGGGFPPRADGGVAAVGCRHCRCGSVAWPLHSTMPPADDPAPPQRLGPAFLGTQAGGGGTTRAPSSVLLPAWGRLMGLMGVAHAHAFDHGEGRFVRHRFSVGRAGSTPQGVGSRPWAWAIAARVNL